MRIKLISFVLLLLIQVSLALASVQEYAYEFNNENETVSLKDYFVYEYKCPSLFNSDRYCPSTPVIYSYCSNESCMDIIFDIQNKRFMNKYNQEIVDLSFVKDQIKNGNISKLNLDLEGFDICSSFGKKEVAKETTNLVASVTESNLGLLEAERARKVKNGLNLLKTAGAIEKFNSGVLLAGATCYYNDKQLNTAVESVVNLDVYLGNIENNYAKEGYLANLSSQIDNSKAILNKHLESLASIALGGVNFAGNQFIALLGAVQNKGYNPKKTSYQLLQDANNKISGYSLYVHNPNNKQILDNHISRINNKIEFYNKERALASQTHSSIDKIKPSLFNKLVTNIFMEPNYNLSNAKDLLDKGLELEENAENNVNVWKLNSALGNLSLAQIYLNNSLGVYQRESMVERKFEL